jgi:hypothetical protein
VILNLYHEELGRRNFSHKLILVFSSFLSFCVSFCLTSSYLEEDIILRCSAVHPRFRGVYCQITEAVRSFETDVFQRHYTALHYRRSSSSYTLPWEPEMSLLRVLCFCHLHFAFFCGLSFFSLTYSLVISLFPHYFLPLFFRIYPILFSLLFVTSLDQFS